MIKTLIKGALGGGAALFLWGMASWMLLPWHRTTLHKFQNEEAVAQAISASVSQGPGIYNYPNAYSAEPGATEEQKKAQQQAGMEKRRAGPLIFVAFRDKGMPSMAKPMAVSFLIQVLAALLVTALVLTAPGLSFTGRVGFCASFALAAGAACHLPYWNWWGFSGSYTLVSIADLVVGWSLAGVVIAKSTTGKN
jgi:hypothetical protein